MKEKRVFLCCGAIGTLGGAIAAQLMEADYMVTTVAITEEKCAQLRAQGIDARPDDLTDLESLKAAGEGIDYVTLVMPLERDREWLSLYTEKIIAACRSSGIKNLVFNTSSRAPREKNNVPGFADKCPIEDRFIDSGLPIIVLRRTICMENLVTPWPVSDIDENLVVKYPIAKENKVRRNSTGDVARHVVAALEKIELVGQSIEIGGPEAADGDEIGRQFSAVLGPDISYEEITPDVSADCLMPFFTQAQTRGLTAYYEYVNAHATQLSIPSEDIALLDCSPRDNFQNRVDRLSPFYSSNNKTHHFLC